MLRDNTVRWLYWGGVALICVGSVVIGHRDLGAFATAKKPPIAQVLQPAFMPGLNTTSQAIQERRFRTISLQLQGSFKVTLNDSPGRIMRSPVGTLLVLDMNDSTVKEYSESGQLLRRYSTTRDEGMPARIIDFALADDGTVWTASSDFELTAIKADGSHTYRLEGIRAFRLLWLGDRLLIETIPAVNQRLSDRLFYTMTPTGRVLSQFGELVVDNPHFGLAVLGQIAPDPQRGGFVFAPHGPNLLVSYEPDGKRRYLVQTIDPLPLPQLEITRSGATKVAHLPVGITRDIAVDRNRIFRLSALQRNPKTTVVDVYDESGGSYLYSFTLPVDCEDLTVWRNTIYAAEGNMLYKWAYPQDF